MDKRVLLVLFCLQVFLLITAFTSTDAATLVRDDQRTRSPNLEVSELGKGKGGPKGEPKYPGCWRRPGACSVAGKVEPKTPTPKPRRMELIVEKKKLQQVSHQN